MSIFKAKTTEDAVSPVIGVILLVAVTVALVALATVIVFDIGSDVSDTADATVQLEQTSSGVQATIVRNENVESFSLVDNGNAGADSVTDGLSSVGDSATIDVTAASADTSGSVAVIANLSGGNSEVLTSTDYDYDVSDTADVTVQLEKQGSDMTATVSRNENVEGSDMTATVSRNENVDGFTLQGNVDDGTTASASFGATAGSVGTLAITQSVETGDIVANVSNGTDIQSIDLYEASDKSSPVETITGNNSASQTETFSGYTTGDYVIGVTDSGTEKQTTKFTHENIQTTVPFDYTAGTKGSITDSVTVLGTNDLISFSVIAALEDGSEEVLISTVSK